MKNQCSLTDARPPPIALVSAQLLAGIIIFASVLSFPSLAADPGLGWHLAAGQFIFENRHLPSADPFLWPPSENIWILNQWGAELIGYGIFALGGWGLIHVCSFLVIWGAHILIPLALLKTTPFRAAPLIFGLLGVIILGSPQWLIRPQLLSFLYFGITVYACRKWLTGQLGSLPFCALSMALFTLWANSHPGFLVGFIAFAAVGLDLLVRKDVRRLLQTISIAGAAMLASLINPYGVHLHLSALDLARDPYFTNLMNEWLPISESSSLSWRFFGVSLLAALGALGHFLRRRTISPSDARIFDWVLLGLLFVLTLEHRRMLAFFAIAATIPLAYSFDSLLPVRHIKTEIDGPRRSTPELVSCVLLCSLIVISLLLVARSWPWSTKEEFRLTGFSTYFPVEDIAKISYATSTKPDAQPLHVFNNPNWGGLITWAYWPHATTFVDDRNELNGRNRYERYYSAVRMEEDSLSWISEQHFDILALPVNSELAKHLSAKQSEDPPIFREISRSEEAVIYRRAP